MGHKQQANNVSGYFYVNPTGDDPFQVYCDFDGGAWAVIQSYKFGNRDYFATGIGVTDDPRNEDDPNWDDYQLSSK